MRALIAPLLITLVVLSGCFAESGSGVPSTPTLTTWDDVNSRFSASCTGCHPPGGSLATTSLDYTTLSTGAGTCPTNSGALVEPGSRSLSCLYLSVAGLEGDGMLGSAPFSASIQDDIGQWIDDGAAGP